MMIRNLFVVSAVVLSLAARAHAAEAPDPRLLGVWKTLTYVVEGVEHPLDGLFLFTERHFSANVFFRLSGGEKDDSNANAGTYRVEGDTLTFEQQVQIHIRPGDEQEPIFYGKDVDEAAKYRIEDDGNRLLVLFPSGNRYICERIEE